MMTMRKKRRISYAEKAKKQRMRLYGFLTVICLLFACTLAPLADNGIHEVCVIADAGDTLWSICEAFKPEDMDLRLFIEKVKYENKLTSSALSIGQEIVIPLS
ncbi:MAG: LysM peptidoglycan-binding domain-containing protein [Ruminococcaceae bacterium]|nr:LysM peptidoglycan-binding domain-containing protein [Oscillospiraceae bacterium]